MAATSPYVATRPGGIRRTAIMTRDLKSAMSSVRDYRDAGEKLKSKSQIPNPKPQIPNPKLKPQTKA
jgi:hypothetical protein